MTNTNSILDSVKKMCGITEDYSYFDLDIITAINSALATLTQLGVGPAGGFLIEDNKAVWNDFMETDGALFGFVKTYVAKKTQMAFDPPTSSSVSSALDAIISELEWRISIAADEQNHGRSILCDD